MTCFNLSLRPERVRRAATHVVLVRVDGFCVEPLLAFLFVVLDVLADPNVAIQPEDEVHSARQRDKVGFQATDEYWRDGH